MNSFTQLENYLIASESAVTSLADAKSAKLLVFSDSHGGQNTLSRVLSYFGSYMDAFVFCGDGIGDLLSVMEDEALIFNHEKVDNSSDRKCCIPPVVAFARGNNDPGSYPVNFPLGETGNFSIQNIKIPPCLVFKACGHKIFLAHGHSYGVYSTLDELKMETKIIGGDFAFFGHTHIPQMEKDGCLLLNPGSLCLPRGGSRPSFAIVTITAGSKNADVTFYKIENFNGTESYKPYDPQYMNLWR